MKTNSTQRRLVFVAFFLLVLPAVVWSLLLALGHVGSPGNPVVPPFNFSDRIVTIEVAPDAEGKLRATFDGADEGAPGLTGDEFLAAIQGRKLDLPWIYGFLDVTSITGVLWVLFGFAGQAVFTARMVVQWQASEKAKSSVVPVFVSKR